MNTAATKYQNKTNLQESGWEGVAKAVAESQETIPTCALPSSVMIFLRFTWSPKLLLRETYTIRSARENTDWEEGRF